MADTPLETLEIEIITKATKSANGLDKFVNSLERMYTTLNGSTTINLRNLSSGLTTLGDSLKGVGEISGRKFDSIVNNVNKLANIQSAKVGLSATGLTDMTYALNQLSSIAPTVATNISELSKGIGRLGGKNIANATTNLPTLTNAFMQMLNTLSKAPAVSRNLIDITNALGNFMQQAKGFKSSANTFSNSLTNMSTRAKLSIKPFNKLASSIGMFYAKFFLLVRGIKKLWSATESSMDYVETFNYYTVALNKISKQFDETYDEMGNDNAETYVNSFTEKLKTLNKKMTGYVLGNNGELFDTDSIGLGLDPDKLMNFQAQILGITNSVGLLGGASVDTAKALSMLSADMSSLTNTDLDEVMTNLKSGLIGQSRALYKYGIDITNTTLKETALAYGIQKSVSAMSQSEKMQLRMLAILNQSKVAWGDQARTINTVANQYRVLKQQISNLGRILGNLFLPIVKTVLPYLNAIVIVLQRLFTKLGFRLWGDNWLSDLNEDISSIGTSNIEDLDDAIDDTTDSVKKLKGQLLGLDELNVINSQDGSASQLTGLASTLDLSRQIADALAEYESVWNEALKKAKNKAEELADKIMDGLKNLNPYKLGKLIAEKLNSVDWSKLFSTVAEKVAEGLNSAISFALGFGETFDFAKFGSSIADGINTFFETFDWSNLAKTINAWVDGFEDFVKGFFDEIDWNTVIDGIKEFFSELEFDSVLTLAFTFATIKLLKDGVPLTITTLTKTIVQKLGGTGTTLVFTLEAVALLKIAYEFGQDFKNWREKIQELGWEKGREQIAKDKGNANPYQRNTELMADFDKFNEWWDKTPLRLSNLIQEMLSKISEFVEKAKEKIQSFVDGLSTVASNVKEKLTEIKTKFDEWKTEMFQWIKTNVPHIGQNLIEGFANLPNKVKEKLSLTKEKFLEWKNETIAWVKAHVPTIITNIANGFLALPQKLKEIGQNAISEFWNGIKEKWDGLKDTVKEFCDGIVEKFAFGFGEHSPSKKMFVVGEYVTEGLKNGMESLYKSTEKSITQFTGQLTQPQKSNYNVNASSRNINGTGTTSVANSLYPVMLDAFTSAMNNGNTTVNVTLEGDANRLFRVVQQESRTFTKRTGQNAFA